LRLDFGNADSLILYESARRRIGVVGDNQVSISDTGPGCPGVGRMVPNHYRFAKE
jgi:hypothetical protein